MNNYDAMRANYQKIVLDVLKLTNELKKHESVTKYFLQEGNPSEKDIVNNILKSY